MRVTNYFSLGLGLIVLLVFQSCRINNSFPVDHQGKTIEWSGLSWFVKEADQVQGPGPNLFSSASDQVWVDASGSLHMTIQKRGDEWYCSEIIAEKELGLGLYRLQIASRVDRLDPNVVFGFFTWNPRSWFHNNEIDIELSSWGKREGPNGQYVIQPYYYPGHLHRFHFDQEGDYSTHEFVWIPYAVFFRSYHGHQSRLNERSQISGWRYTGFRVPRPKNTHVRLNLWLDKSKGLSQQDRIEIVIKRFVFIPLADL